MPPHSNLNPPPAHFRVLSLAVLPDAAVHGLVASDLGPFALRACADATQLIERLDGEATDALLYDVAADAAGAAEAHVAASTEGLALLVVLDGPLDPHAAVGWLQRGAQDVVARDDLGAASLALRLRAAIERKKIEREVRKAYATDLDTGLPHQQQLIEHMSQLMALREREPSPMAVLVLRIEGLASAQARFGPASAAALRRKLAVRLRAGVRASDVVASIGDDSFAVLLGALLTTGDEIQVGAKLVKAVTEPFRLGGQELAVAVALGIAQHPKDGSQPEALLRSAVALAASASAQGRAGFANFHEAGGAAEAANDASSD